MSPHRKSAGADVTVCTSIGAAHSGDLGIFSPLHHKRQKKKIRARRRNSAYIVMKTTIDLPELPPYSQILRMFCMLAQGKAACHLGLGESGLHVTNVTNLRKNSYRNSLLPSFSTGPGHHLPVTSSGLLTQRVRLQRLPGSNLESRLPTKAKTALGSPPGLRLPPEERKGQGKKPKKPKHYIHSHMAEGRMQARALNFLVKLMTDAVGQD
ncbi:hypothetical protein B0H65DRAFT_113298 [Neurospora tetraspora]|uniref:Uncharacterized protein n=1 Tax=Neurospora tetraspora TaxID=94610 RepID=A0AAE0JKG9_9PEZI|nr:hypothetical protein B0H65DRAFT_113298 [Neurospora tetraspora]